MTDKRRKTRQAELAFGEERETQSPESGRVESVKAAEESENPAGTERLMEEVCERENLLRALKKVKDNKGAPGVDGMTVDKLPGFLRKHWPMIRERLFAGSYEPKPVRKVEIPKPTGGTRQLGIPCVLDRFIQQAMLDVLQRRWDSTFSEYSYGFRPGRSAHQAVAQAQKYVAEGYEYVVDIDLEKFLDRSSQCTPADQTLSKRVCCWSKILIRKPFLFPRRTWTAWSSPRFTRCHTV
jgi:RNA-directed DNA polymerase